MERSEPLDLLVEELQRGSSLARRIECARKLGCYGPVAAGAVRELARATRHDSRLLRREALWALGKTGRAAEGALRDVVQRLGDPDPEVRQTAVWALTRMGPAAAPALWRRLAVGRRGEPQRRREEHRIWGALSRMGSSALPYLLRGLRDPDEPLRPWCAYGIAHRHYCSSAARDAMHRGASDPDVAGRAWALAALPAPADEPVVAFLREARGDPWLRDVAKWALKRIGVRPQVDGGGDVGREAP